VIADPLELERDMVQGDQESQVAGDGLLRGNRDHDRVGDLALGIVHLDVVGDDLASQLEVAIDDRPDGCSNL